MPSIMSMPNLQSNLWENSAIECDTSELVRLIDDAENINATDRIEGYILGSVKSLKTQRAKPDPVLYLSLMYLSKSRDYLFQTKDILDAFCSLLRRDVKEAYKAKGNALVSVLAANVLMSALRNERTWPGKIKSILVFRKILRFIVILKNNYRFLHDDYYNFWSFLKKKEPAILFFFVKPVGKFFNLQFSFPFP